MKEELEEIVMVATSPVGRGSGVGRADVEAENNPGHLPGDMVACPGPHHLLPTKGRGHSGPELLGILLGGQLILRRGTL